MSFRQVRDALGVLADMGGVLGLVGLGISSLTGLSVMIAGFLLRSSVALVVGVALLLVVIVVLGLAVAYLLVRFTSAELERGYRWTSAWYRYSFDSQDPHYHQQHVRIRITALRNGVCVFSNQYLWSGWGVDDGPRVLTPGQRLLGTVERSSGWSRYRVELATPLRRGESADVEVVQELCDSEEAFLPFLAKTVQEPIGTLTLSVDLPDSSAVQGAWRIVRDGFGPGAREVSREQAVVGPGDTDLRFTVEGPRRGYNYELAWAYAHGRSVYG